MLRQASCGIVFAALLSVAGCSTVYMKGTPFYTGEYQKPQGPPQDRVNLWPFAYYHRPALSVLWPLMDFTDDHMAVRPVFTVYKLDKPRHEWNLFWPFVQFDLDVNQHRILPFFWGKDSGGKPYFVAFPEVWWYKDTKGIFPAFWWKDGFTVFPLGWYKKDDYSSLFPLWVDFLYGKGQRDTWVLWPLIRRLNREHVKGWHVWPFAGDYREGVFRTSFALWPLCRYHRDGDEVERHAIPFYFEESAKDKSWWLLVPFAYRAKEGNDSMLVTPLWSAGTRGDARWSALVPLFYHEADAKKGTTTLITPLVGHSTEPKRTEWALLPLLSSLAWGEGEKDLWLLAPLVHARWGGKNVEHHVLPLYYYDRDKKLFLSLPVSRVGGDGKTALFFLGPLAGVEWGKGGFSHYVFPLYLYDADDKSLLTPLVSWQNKGGEGFVNVAMFLAHYAYEADGGKSLGLLWPFGNVTWGGKSGGASARLFPLFSWKRTKGDSTPGAAKDFRSHHQSTKLWFFPWAYVERSEETRTSPKEPEAKPLIEKTRSNGAWPLWTYKWQSSDWADTTKRVGDKWEWEMKRLDKPHVEGSFDLLWFLYDWQLRLGAPDKDDPKKTFDYVRSRILWRLMHYERLDGDESLDLFPFVTWDRKADGYRKFSFAWRLYRNERTADGGRNVDLFFIPFLRTKGSVKGPQAASR